MDADWIITLLLAQLEDTDLAILLRENVAEAGEALRRNPQYDDFALELSGRYGQRAVSILEPQLISVESMGAA